MTPLQSVLRLSSGLHLRLQLAGQGPAVVLCHESPRSSEALLPLAARLADRFTCVMLDTPGFGLSDPLALERPEITDYAEAVLEVIARLGLGRVPVYGTHTGAAIAVEAARLDPDRVAAAILDGYAIFTAAERDQLLASYLPPLRPSLDGTTPAWLWSRVRDQFTAFPWNQVGDGSRLGYGPPPLAHMQNVVCDFLQAGDAYRAAYAAAFRYDHYAPLPEVRVPVRIVTREDDMLFPHMERARGAGDHVTTQALSPDRDAWGRALAGLLAEHAGAEATDAAEIAGRAGAHAGALRFAGTAAGPVLLRDEGEGAPVVLLHDAPGGMADLDGLAARLARRRRVVRLDLPGLGRSRLRAGAAPEAATLAGAVAQALEAAGLSDAPVVAFGASLPVAAALPGRARVIAADPWTLAAPDAAAEVPDLAPSWDGGHLMAAFWWARDAEIYKPWFNRVNAELRPLGNERDLPRIHARFRDTMLAGETGTAVARALFAASAGSALVALKGRAEVLTYAGDPDAARLAALAVGALGEGAVSSVPRAPERLAQALAERLG